MVGIKGDKKIAVLVKYGLDHFVDEVAMALAQDYEVQKFIIKDLKGIQEGKACTEIDEAMAWSDICWFEWCDELIAYGSKSPLAMDKKIICRIHSYEVFTDYPHQVNWSQVDQVIFVAQAIREFAMEHFKLTQEQVITIPNGIDMKKYVFRERSAGFNIAYVGFINYKKGPMLLLHTFKAIYDRDPRYKLYIAGQFQDDRDILYFRQMIQEWGLEKNIIYEGWQEHLDEWLEDKQYILCTSVLESQNMSVMQAMAKGIKPIIHHFVGAKSIYPSHLIFNTIDEAVELLGQQYDSHSYERFVREQYSLERISKQLVTTIQHLTEEEKKRPLVSVVVAVYNREKFVAQAIESIRRQSYEPIEIIVVNDGSTDQSHEIISAIQDKRIKYFNKENTGQLATLKYGFEQATGEFITRVDSDDLIHEDYITNCMAAMQEDPKVQFVYTDFRVIDNEGKALFETPFTDYDTALALINDMLAKCASVIPDVAFFRKSYLPNVICNYTEQNVPYYIDNILTTPFQHIKQPLYYYRQHEANFISEEENLRLVVSGKIKFVDLILRRYFIQLDPDRNFWENQNTLYRLFAEYFKNMQAHYSQLEGIKEITPIQEMFQEEAHYWETRVREPQLNEATHLLQKNKNQRLLMVSTDNPQGGRAVGGKHTHIDLLLKGITEKGIHSQLIVYEPSQALYVDPQKAVAYLSTLVAPCDEVLEDCSFTYIVYTIQKQLEDKIEAALVNNYYSFISCQDVIATMAAYQVIRRLKFVIPIVTTLHGYFTDENVDYGMLQAQTNVYRYFKRYEEKAYQVSDRIIAVDTRIKAYVNKFEGKQQRPIYVLKNAVDDQLFVHRPIQARCESPQMLFVPRRLVPKNGVIYVVEAMDRLWQQGIRNVQLVIAGDGIERATIESYIQAHTYLAPLIQIRGAIAHNQIQALYEQAYIVVIPSIRSNDVEEATSIALLEGMASGKVVIASEIGGMKEIIEDGKNGFFVKQADSEHLSQKIIEVLQLSNEKYSAISQQARADIEAHYGYQKHAQTYMQFVEAPSEP